MKRHQIILILAGVLVLSQISQPALAQEFDEDNDEDFDFEFEDITDEEDHLHHSEDEIVFKEEVQEPTARTKSQIFFDILSNITWEKNKLEIGCLIFFLITIVNYYYGRDINKGFALDFCNNCVSVF